MWSLCRSAIRILLTRGLMLKILQTEQVISWSAEIVLPIFIGKFQKYHKISEYFQKYHTAYTEIPHLQISVFTLWFWLQFSSIYILATWGHVIIAVAGRNKAIYRRRLLIARHYLLDRATYTVTLGEAQPSLAAYFRLGWSAYRITSNKTLVK